MSINKQHEVTVLTEQVDDGKLKRKIKVFESNSGRYIAEYTVGTVMFQVPVNGRTAIEAMKAAKKWLDTPMRFRR